jgi:hypothetical protein
VTLLRDKKCNFERFFLGGDHEGKGSFHALSTKNEVVFLPQKIMSSSLALHIIKQSEAFSMVLFCKVGTTLFYEA